MLLSHLSVAANCKRLRKGQNPDGQKDGFFPDIDAALEWCENQLIAAENVDNGCGKHHPSACEEMDILAGFDSKRNRRCCSQSSMSLSMERARSLCAKGDPADSLFLLASGLVNVCLRLGDGMRQKRLATIAPGGGLR